MHIGLKAAVVLVHPTVRGQGCLIIQVEVPVEQYADGRPHYAWLPLAGRAAGGSMAGEVNHPPTPPGLHPEWMFIYHLFGF